MTYGEFRAAVVADILEQMNGEPDGSGTCWSQADAESCVGNVWHEFVGGKAARDVANGILYIVSQLH
jgi:hypothetical protein